MLKITTKQKDPQSQECESLLALGAAILTKLQMMIGVSSPPKDEKAKVIKEEFYVIDPPDSAPKVVIKGLPISTEINEIQDDLTSQGFSVEKVAQLTRSKTKAPLPIFMVELEKKPDSPDIFKLKSAATSRCRSTLLTDDRGFHSVTTVTCLTTRRKTASCAPDV
ncbi:hypothetical protein TNCV_1790331 [Trichonephila clavipes]|nr:hypothetical protein TNCV_1790331 [Trichonephila clavipes]